MATSHKHDPDAVRDYGWDWAADLEVGETITDVSCTVDDPAVTIVSQSYTDTVSISRCTGGTVGTDPKVTPQHHDLHRRGRRSFTLVVLER